MCHKNSILVGLCCLLCAGTGLAQDQPAAAAPDPYVQTLLEELQKKEQAVASYYAESTHTEFRSGGEGASPRGRVLLKTKTWKQGDYQRIEQQGLDGAISHITIHHPGIVYLYNAETDRWTKQENLLTKEYMRRANEALASTSKILDPEMIDGKEAVVIGSDAPLWGIPVMSKRWYWKDTGLPVKVEIFTKLGDQTLIMLEETTYTFQAIPNDKFKVPLEKVEE